MCCGGQPYLQQRKFHEQSDVPFISHLLPEGQTTIDLFDTIREARLWSFSLPRGSLLRFVSCLRQSSL